MLSDHFGRTPRNSQEIEEDETEEDEVVPFEPQEEEELVGGRMRDYLAQAEVEEERSGASGDDNDEYLDDGAEDVPGVRKFISEGCGCKLDCQKHFSYNDIVGHVYDIRALTKDEKEINIMTLLKDCMSETTERGKRRKRCRQFKVEGKHVCKRTFMLFYDIGKHALKAIQSHVAEKGITPRVHGNTGKKPRHAICFDDVMRVVNFVRNVADTRGLPQPAAPRGIDNVPIVFLPSGTTKEGIFKDYAASCQEAGVRDLRLTSFKDIWRTCLPHIRIGSPRHDVCATCEKMRRTIMDARAEQEKLDATESFRDHILIAREVRLF